MYACGMDRDLRVLLRAYNDIIEKSVEGYQGRFHEVIENAPRLFRLFCNLLDDPRVPSGSRPVINGTLLYFIAPFDTLPEEICGPVGYLDDLFLSARALLRLEEQMGRHIIESNWEGERGLRDVIEELNEMSKEFMGNLEEEIHDYFNVWTRQSSHPHRHSQGMHIVREMLGTI